MFILSKIWAPGFYGMGKARVRSTGGLLAPIAFKQLKIHYGAGAILVLKRCGNISQLYALWCFIGANLASLLEDIHKLEAFEVGT